ncbi:hypothetical protein [Adhaeretor mobilis]|uniref:Uncharacterized protein n=1 Tax=Adhaeretor mobilis TaxID=1930276 RepID=A0A517MQ62_9BACT|nr:hypothetical protein [Adhaeretor mobilis]QDS97025.1 hypothetical protein HG15A2_02840 [Adhaeretor mobilis]
MLTVAERRVLDTYQEYLITPGQMLCFSGPNLERDKETLELMSEKELLTKESFRGGYSLTRSGFAAMKDGE